MLLDNIALFMQIVEKGSLAAAGREVGLSSTTVSERLAALAAHFGVSLLNRTTRAMSLTDEGRMLVEDARGDSSDMTSPQKMAAIACALCAATGGLNFFCKKLRRSTA
ncbi:helix-turn-helix domain-containing protein [Pseudomonas sp. MWU13-2100]|uniref:helix-turn-helix domain-containing protein n=1 Tax=Pseudomonas sp. MWU13-2100 TaxID=2935075 RepID=UPI00200D249F|nr:LysR family transcriptional regulator [Pseudomonas sp. MWU13-2100]